MAADETDIPAVTPDNLAQAVFPTPQNTPTAPPKDQVELQQRAGVWSQILTKVRDDPGIQAMLFHMGTSLMQPIEPGQTRLGHLGHAMNVGMTAMRGTQSYGDAQQLRLREEARKEQETAAGTGLTRAQTTTEQGRPSLQSAQTRLTTAQAGSVESRMQPEIDLIRAQVKQANSHADLFNLEGSFKSLETALKAAYGPAEAAAKIESLKADTGYKVAMAGYASAHARQAAATTDAMTENWTQTVQRGDDGNVVIVNTNKKDGAKQITRTIAPLSEGEAAAKAKQDVAAVKNQVAGYFGGGEPEDKVAARVSGDTGAKTLQDAVRVLTERYKKGGIYTTNIGRDGTVTSTDAAKTPSGSASSSAPPTAPGEPISTNTVVSSVPVPPELAKLPPGSKVPDKSGQWWEITAKGLVKAEAPVSSAPAEDTAKYTRSQIRGGYDYTRNHRGKTKAEWAAIDAAARGE